MDRKSISIEELGYGVYLLDNQDIVMDIHKHDIGDFVKMQEILQKFEGIKLTLGLIDILTEMVSKTFGGEGEIK